MTTRTVHNWFAKYASISLKLLPILGGAAYVIQYAYAEGFLQQFASSPEQADISQFSLLSRAAILGVVLLIYVVLLIPIVALLIAVTIVLGTLATVRLRTGIPIKNIDPPWGTRSRSRFQMTVREPAGMRERREKLLLASSIGGAVVFAAVLAIAELADYNRSEHLGRLILISAICAWITGVTLYMTSTLFSDVAAVCILGTALVVLVIVGLITGVLEGNRTANTGRVPDLPAFMGVDVSEVHPEWVGPGSAPKGFDGQDMLKIGGGSSTLFLYDCQNVRSYQLPPSSVLLSYNLYQTNLTQSELVKLLRC